MWAGSISDKIDGGIRFRKKEFKNVLEYSWCKKPMFNINIGLACAPKGSRTPVAAVKGLCPRPLDDGSLKTITNYEF